MKKIILIGMGIFLILLIGCEAKEEEIKFTPHSNNNDEIWIRPMNPPDYSQEGYFKFQAYSSTERFILLECINSSLTIDNTSISCVPSELPEHRFDVVNNNKGIIFSEINNTGVVFLSIYSKDKDTIIISYEDKVIGNVSKKILCGKYEK